MAELEEKLRATEAQVQQVRAHDNTTVRLRTFLKAPQTQKIPTKTKRELEEYKLDAEGLRELLEIKKKEMRRIRKLATHVLDQRTELEQFFLDALQEVKMEIMKKRHEKERVCRRNVYVSLCVCPWPLLGPAGCRVTRTRWLSAALKLSRA